MDVATLAYDADAAKLANDSVVVGLCEPEPPCPVSQSSFVERACTHVRPPQHWLLLGDNLLPTSGRFAHYEYFNPPEAPYGLDSWSDDHELCLSLGLEGDHQVIVDRFSASFLGCFSALCIDRCGVGRCGKAGWR